MERVREGRHAPSLNQVIKPLLLSLGIADGQPDGIGHAKRLKSCPGANEAWLACDMRLVHLGREQVRVRESAQRFTPGVFMRRCEQNAINVENGRFQWSLLQNSHRCANLTVYEDQAG